MIPRRDNLSVPISRTGSASRLNQINSPGRTSLFPSTPSAYQVSSLNPLRSNTKSVPPNDEFENKFNQLDMVKTVNEFEEQLALLSQKVTSFDGENLDQNINSLIAINDKMLQQVSQLDKHKQLGDTIDILEKDKQTLDERSTGILKQLIQFRTELKQLPTLPTKTPNPDDELVTVNVSELLKYGLKLSKFTKVPPTPSGMAHQIHPNNFIWPAEDSLRRGMLAMSSLKSDEIIKAELGLTNEPEPKLKPTEKEITPPEDSQNTEAKLEPKKIPRQSAPKESAPAPALDLDLFDPEEEDSD